MSSLSEQDAATNGEVSNGETVEVDGEQYVPIERHERLVEKHEDLAEKVERLTETVEDLQLGVQNAVTTAVEARDKAEAEDNEPTEYVPPSKLGRIKKLINENFDEWSCGGDVRTKTRRTKRGSIKKRSINQFVKSELREQYDETCQDGQIYEAMKRLAGEKEQYEYKETDTAKILSTEKR